MTHISIHCSSVSSLPNYNVLRIQPQRKAHILPTPFHLNIRSRSPQKRKSKFCSVVYIASQSDSKPPFPASPPALHLLTLLPLPSRFRGTPCISGIMPHVSMPPGVWISCSLYQDCCLLPVQMSLLCDAFPITPSHSHPGHMSCFFLRMLITLPVWYCHF